MWHVFLNQWKGVACLGGLIHSQVGMCSLSGFSLPCLFILNVYIKVNETNTPVALGTTLFYAMYFFFFLTSLYDFK